MYTSGIKVKVKHILLVDIKVLHLRRVWELTKFQTTIFILWPSGTQWKAHKCYNFATYRNNLDNYILKIIQVMS